MAEEYPYVQSANKLQEFLANLEGIGVPAKINQKWLESLGYKSTNDRSFLAVLRFLGLIDDSGSPTDAYRSTLRSGDGGRATFAKVIRESYADLFSTYPDAYRKDNEALQNFFTAHTDVGAKAIQLMVSTFKTVCSFADFETEETVRESSSNGADKNAGRLSQETNAVVSHDPANPVKNSAQPLVINVNIQLEIPATSDSSIYDNLFKSMSKHILRLSSTDE